METTTETIDLTLSVMESKREPSRGWVKADWLVTVGTVLEQGKFTGVDGKTITYEGPVVEQIVSTALNKHIHVFHKNKPDQRKEKVGRIYAVQNSEGVGKIKYVTWDKDANAGIESGEYALSLEAQIMAVKLEGGYKAVSGNISGVALVNSPAVAAAINETVEAVALSEGESTEVENAASAEPGIRFPANAQLSEKDLSPCISLLQKNGLEVSKKGSSVEMSEEENTPVTPTGEVETEVEQEVVEPVVETPIVEPTPEVSSDMKVLMERMATMEKTMTDQSQQIATLEGTDLDSIKQKILLESPKADLKILLSGARDVDEQKLILNAHLAGLVSRDTTDESITGVDVQNEGEKPDPIKMEESLYEDLLGDKDPFNERSEK